MKRPTLRYELSHDGFRLKKWTRNEDDLEVFYHVHRNEMTELEHWIYGLLITRQKKGGLTGASMAPKQEVLKENEEKQKLAKFILGHYSYLLPDMKRRYAYRRDFNNLTNDEKTHLINYHENNIIQFNSYQQWEIQNPGYKILAMYGQCDVCFILMENNSHINDVIEDAAKILNRSLEYLQDKVKLLKSFDSCCNKLTQDILSDITSRSNLAQADKDLKQSNDFSDLDSVVQFLCHLINPFQVEEITIQEANRISSTFSIIVLDFLLEEIDGISINTNITEMDNSKSIYELCLSINDINNSELIRFRLYKAVRNKYFKLEVLKKYES